MSTFLFCGRLRKSDHGRPEKPLMLIDIAVPRDIDPKVKEIEGVSLYDVDDLEAVVKENLNEREKELGKVDLIVNAETDRFMSWWDSQEVVSVISFMRQRAEDIRSMEVEKAFGKLKSLSDADRQVIDVLTKSIVNKMLHHPTMTLKECAGDQEQLEAVQRAMGLCDMQGMKN